MPQTDSGEFNFGDFEQEFLSSFGNYVPRDRDDRPSNWPSYVGLVAKTAQLMMGEVPWDLAAIFSGVVGVDGDGFVFDPEAEGVAEFFDSLRAYEQSKGARNVRNEDGLPIYLYSQIKMILEWAQAQSGVKVRLFINSR